MNYFKITGLDNGVPIEPYCVETNGSYPQINIGLYQDSVRYYEPITKEEYNKLIKEVAYKEVKRELKMKRFRENKVEQGYKKIEWYIKLDKLDKEIRNQGFGVLDLMVFNSLHDIMRERNFTTEEISWYYNEAHDLAVGAILKDEGGFNTDDICEAALDAVILGEDISPRELLLTL